MQHGMARCRSDPDSPPLYATRSPRNAMFPVMKAENTLPRARKLMASTAPDETVNALSSRSRILSSTVGLWRVADGFTQSQLPTTGVCLSRRNRLLLCPPRLVVNWTAGLKKQIKRRLPSCLPPSTPVENGNSENLGILALVFGGVMLLTGYSDE